MAEVSETRQELALVCPSDIIFCGPGNDAVLSCHLEPAINAASMEIKWWNKSDLVCHYKDGQVTVSRDYEGRVSLSLQELHNGNVSLTLRDVKRSQRGIYICEVIHGCQTIKEYICLHISSQDFRLVVPTGSVRTNSGSNIILPAHLTPKTNAVSAEIRWFKGAQLIYQYKNRQEMTDDDYKNRLSVSIQELRRGNLALTLSNVQQSDSGDYTCTIFHDRCQKTGVIHLQVREHQKHKQTDKCKNLADELTFKKTPNYAGTYTEQRISNVGESSTCTQDLKILMRAVQEQERISDPTTKRRRRTSMDGDRPLMSEDWALEKAEIEKREPRVTVGRESGHQNTRQMREGNTATVQELSSPHTSSPLLRMQRASVLFRDVCATAEPNMQTHKRLQQTIVRRQARRYDTNKSKEARRQSSKKLRKYSGKKAE